MTAYTHEPDSEASVCRKCKTGSIGWPPVLISRPAVQLIFPHIPESAPLSLDTVVKRWASARLTRSAEPRRAKVREGVHKRPGGIKLPRTRFEPKDLCPNNFRLVRDLKERRVVYRSDYSSRNATIGSISTARSTGPTEAMSTIPASRHEVNAKVAGSSAPTPYSIDRM